MQNFELRMAKNVCLFVRIAETSIGLGWKTAHSHTSPCYKYFYLNLSTTVLQIETTKQVFYSGTLL